MQVLENRLARFNFPQKFRMFLIGGGLRLLIDAAIFRNSSEENYKFVTASAFLTNFDCDVLERSSSTQPQTQTTRVSKWKAAMNFSTPGMPRSRWPHTMPSDR